jgi:hypothetical protein
VGLILLKLWSCYAFALTLQLEAENCVGRYLVDNRTLMTVSRKPFWRRILTLQFSNIFLKLLVRLFQLSTLSPVAVAISRLQQINLCPLNLPTRGVVAGLANHPLQLQLLHRICI